MKVIATEFNVAVLFNNGRTTKDILVRNGATIVNTVVNGETVTFYCRAAKKKYEAIFTALTESDFAVSISV